MMPNVVDVTLTRIERNAVFNMLTTAEFDPADFEWKDHPLAEDTPMGIMHSTASTLLHRQTGYYCKFGRYYCEFVPGTRAKVEAQAHNNNWALRERSIRLWLHRLRQEVDAPDLWASIGQEKALSTAASSADIDNRTFTADEQKLIARKLDEIKASLLEGQQFAADQAEFVEREFTYLKDASKRFGRKDWLRLLLSVLIGQAINLALDPMKAKSLLRLAGTVMQWIWGTMQGYLG